MPCHIPSVAWVLALAACAPSEVEKTVYWKDAVELGEYEPNIAPVALWNVSETAPLLGEITATSSGGFVAPVHQIDSGFAWLRSWDGGGRLRFDSPQRLVYAPVWAVSAATSTGSVLVDFSTGRSETSEERQNLSQVIGPAGGVLQERYNFDWIPWTKATPLTADQVLLIAQPDPTQSTFFCRVSVSALTPLWCDSIAYPYASYEEDTEHYYEHRYIPVVEHAVVSPDGSFFMGGSLPGTRQTQCCADCYCVTETMQTWVAKYTDLGQEVWFKRFATDAWAAFDQPIGIVPTEDGGAMVGGWTVSQMSATAKQTPFVVRFDEEGEVRFARTYDGVGHDVFTTFTPDGRGGALAHVVSNSLDTQLTMQIDKRGDIEWSKSFDLFDRRYATDQETGLINTRILGGTRMLATPDGGFLVVSYGDLELQVPTEVAKHQ